MYPSIQLLNVDTIIEGLAKSKEFLNNNFKMELIRVGHYREKEYVTECNQTLLYAITISSAVVSVITVVLAIRCACKKLVMFSFLSRTEKANLTLIKK